MTRWSLLTAIGFGLVLGGCSSPPEEQAVETMDTKCGELAARFERELAFGESFGMADLAKLEERVALIEDLRNRAREATVPDRVKVDTWLAEIDELVGSMETLAADSRTATMGSDLVLAMQMNLIDDRVDAVGRAAAETTFPTCADVEAWKIFPKE